MPFINQQEITTQYKEIKELGRFIRSQRFNVKKREGLTDLNFRITHIKSSEFYNDVEVNIKVSGNLYRWGYWRNSEERNGRNIVEMTNYPRRRNDDIRQAVRNEIKDFFKLLGVPGWKIEIKKITVAESI
jgi:hypothetical protein